MTIEINRAPVLTLWASIVAERLGFERGAALTLGRAIAGLTAQSKGQWLGIYEKREKGPAEAGEGPDEVVFVNLLDRAVPAVWTPDGLRASDKGNPVDPESVRRYLRSKFGDRLAEVEAAMRSLADSFTPDRLAEDAYSLYEQFRPKVEKGKRGWGATGELDLEKIVRLRPRPRPTAR